MASNQEQFDEVKHRILKEIYEAIKRLEEVIVHYDESIETYTEKFHELVKIMESENFTYDMSQYKFQLWECYHDTMSWLIEEVEYEHLD